METSPHIVYTWGLYQQDIGLSQIIEPTRVICFSAKWLGERRVLFYSEHHDGREAMLQAAWDLLDQADVVCHYNGKTFDVPHLNREFVEAGMTPPSPYKQIDLYKVVKARFRFASNKLDHIARELGVGAKVQHEGFTLWRDCLAGDERAWRKMRLYSKQDTALLEPLYLRLRPWVPSHPSVTLLTGQSGCPACGSADGERRGYAYTATATYQQYRCRDCGKWYRATKRTDSTDVVGVAQ